MARTRSQLARGVLLLDSQGLSKYIANDPKAVALVRAAQSKDALVAISNLTLLEAWNPRARMDQLRWEVSRLEVVPVTDEITWRALDLLRNANLHGHKYAIDAVVASTALGYPGIRVIATSDVDDMIKLCGQQVTTVGV